MLQYNGEYAREGEDWPPAEAFGGADTEQRPSTAPSQQAAGPSPLRLTAALPPPEVPHPQPHIHLRHCRCCLAKPQCSLYCSAACQMGL